MRSLASAFAAVALAACGTDFGTPTPTPDAGSPDDELAKRCAESYLDYGNFGAVFTADWCRGCHGAAVPGDMRQQAPVDVNFDDLAAIRHWSERILVRSTGTAPTMPPAGGPSDAERALLEEWLRCGAKE